MVELPQIGEDGGAEAEAVRYVAVDEEVMMAAVDPILLFRKSFGKGFEGGSEEFGKVGCFDSELAGAGASCSARYGYMGIC